MAANDVNAIQTESQSLMTEQYNNVKEFVAILREQTEIAGIEYEFPTLEGKAMETELLGQAAAEVASHIPQNLNPSPPLLPHVPVLGALANISPSAVTPVADFDGVQPTYTAPTEPNATLPTAPSAPAELTMPEVPAVPSVTAIPPPQFSELVPPQELGLNIPTLTTAMPVSSLTAPSERFEFNEAEYASMLSDSLKAKLLYDMENGGYGIEEGDEARLWARARERASVVANAKVEETLRASASRGFALPPGADMAAVEAAQQAALEEIANVDRDIALKRADMYVENRKFTITAAREVESMFIAYRSAMMERTLNAAKTLVELGIATFNAQVELFNTRLDAYKTEASVFAERLRAEQVKVDIFRGRIDAYRGSLEARRTQADIYKTQVEAQELQVQIYNAQMQALRARVEVERSKVELFRTRVEAYSAQIGARGKEFDLYEAKVRGQVAIQEGFKSQVEAYRAKVEAFRVRVEGEEARVRALAAANQSTIETYKGAALVYTATLENSLTRYKVDREYYGSQLLRYKLSSENFWKQIELGMEAIKFNVTHDNKHVDRLIAQANKDVEYLFKLTEQRTEAAKIGGDVTAQLAVAAAQQITGLSALLKTG